MRKQEMSKDMDPLKLKVGLTDFDSNANLSVCFELPITKQNCTIKKLIKQINEVLFVFKLK